MHALAETPVALDDGIGCVDAVNDDGHAGAAGNHDDGAVLPAKAVDGRSDQYCQCHCRAHDCGFQILSGNLVERGEPKG